MLFGKIDIFVIPQFVVLCGCKIKKFEVFQKFIDFYSTILSIYSECNLIFVVDFQILKNVKVTMQIREMFG